VPAAPKQGSLAYALGDLWAFALPLLLAMLPLLLATAGCKTPSRRQKAKAKKKCAPFASLAFVTLACYPGGNGGLRAKVASFASLASLAFVRLPFAFGYSRVQNTQQKAKGAKVVTLACYPGGNGGLELFSSY
jgi:hypothetical protein